MVASVPVVPWDSLSLLHQNKGSNTLINKFIATNNLNLTSQAATQVLKLPQIKGGGLHCNLYVTVNKQ